MVETGEPLYLVEFDGVVVGCADNKIALAPTSWDVTQRRIARPITVDELLRGMEHVLKRCNVRFACYSKATRGVQHKFPTQTEELPT
ncbi:hypothetical protein BN2476_1930009 [Paraburkholderia piptadeniae]|uniref:Uncharacterized protein n=1 Tax=Paraburkholderia piptadeniae TaxID=1701573 RepID=A0A1N7SXA0_9BURK|nr:hypothetical protein BN2476_1930009 [Paraburkholderia piptadeniae]